MARMFRETSFGAMMAKLHPADAAQDQECKRLLDNIDRLTEPKPKGAKP